jgi:hypothetical protein
MIKVDPTPKGIHTEVEVVVVVVTEMLPCVICCSDVVMCANCTEWQGRR